MSISDNKYIYSIVGEAFVNFISIIITNRIIKALKKCEFLGEKKYGDIIEDLNCSWRRSVGDSVKSYDDNWFNTLPETIELLEKLGLSEPLVREYKNKGRPSKEETCDKPKRPRGRPRKEVF